MKVNKVEKIKPITEVSISLNKPFIASNNNKDNHESKEGFQGMLKESIDELKEKDNKAAREKELLELRRKQIELSQMQDDSYQKEL